MISPAALRTGDTVIEIFLCVPSFATRVVT
jgi:hypothetical protein